MNKHIIVRSLIICMLLGYVLCPSRSVAQHYIDIQAKTDTDKIRLGEQVRLQLSAKVQLQVLKGAAYKIVFPNIPDSFGHFELVERSPLDTSGDESEKFFKQTFTLTSFDSGHWEIPALKFEVYSTTDGSYDSVFTQPVPIDVNTVAVDTTKAFKPIKNVRSAPWNFWDYWIWFAAGLVLILAAIGLWRYFRKRNKVKPTPPPAPKVAPHELALRELHQLASEKLWQQGDVKGYYTRMTDILRNYFEQQFNIAALEQTSAELLQNIKPITILSQQRDKLRTILTIADLAKFAKLQPSPDEHEDCLTKSLEIVEWTKPKAETITPPTDAKPPANQPGNTSEA